MPAFKRALHCLALLSLVQAAVSPAKAYSLLSHEAIVDAMWDVHIKPILLKAYPSATPDELKRAHGFAYGGAIVQDLGYYPHGNTRFSDLTHYVRTGDFVLALFHESHNLNELAFALGALSHYVADINGHKEGTNVAEPILYPKLFKKFGPVVTYEDDPASHLKTEFGFDVLEVARGNFAPDAYRDFIGFFVAKELVARAFSDTYGLNVDDLFFSFDLAVSGYRSAASRTIPLATRVAWAQKKDEIKKSVPGITHRRFVYIMRRSSYERDWGKRLQEPNRFERFLAAILKLIPKIGPLKALGLKIPTPEAERLFMASFNNAVAQYAAALDQQTAQSLSLPDKNYDTGDDSPPGAYRLCDQTYAFWLHALAAKNFSTATPAIKQRLRTFYKDPSAPNSTKQNAVEWKRTLNELTQLPQ